MKTAILTAPSMMRVMDIENPRLTKPADVLIRIDYAGICGSDLHYFRTGRIGDQLVEFPFVMGHECVGTIREIGKDVTFVKIGDRVAVEPAVSCGVCDQCRIGRSNTCRHLKFLGCPGQLSGAMAEFLIMPESSCFPLPEELPLKEAVFVEPMSIALYAWQFLKGLDVRSIGILGAGPIGLSVLLAAQERKDVRSYVTDKIDARLQVAQNLGAYWTVNPDKSEIVQNTEFELDAVFECCGQSEALNHAAKLLKPGGHLVIVGIPEVDDILWDLHLHRRKEITIHNVRRQNECIEEAVHFCANHVDEIGPLVTHSFLIEDVQKAFDMTAGYWDGVVKAVIGF
ncbi:alcohol dehydrogenase catalytic domain-containing protein [candidate division KSB1 bacterium]|nr:alcohol dehydrogenase catalytic domain-containing protein [candidate division KSB1 bacterium]